MACSNEPKASAFNVWHEYSVWIIFATGILFLVAPTIAGKRSTRHKQTSSPLVRNPNDLIAEIIAEKEEIKQPLAQPRSTSPPETERENVGQAASATVRRPRLAPKRVTGLRVEKKSHLEGGQTRKIQPLIFYFSWSGSLTTRYAAERLEDFVITRSRNNVSILAPKLLDLALVDHEDFFEHSPRQGETEISIQYFYLLLIPSYNIDTTLDSFLSLLKETHNDFRIDTAPLSDLAGYSVFGFGDREGWPTEDDGFCAQAIEADRWMAKLTARKRAYPIGLGDVKSDATARFEEWREGMLKAIEDIAIHGSLGEGAPGSGEALESDEEEAIGAGAVSQAYTRPTAKLKITSGVSRLDDLEDLGSKERSLSPNPPGSLPSPLPIDFTVATKTSRLKPMVPSNSPTHAALTKQGYTIIGSHSGVKICRWTKSALRGRGSCYKYSFYGIQSHLCMETTPSLSCSNKCVFCWRHGTNPVGTTWRWQIDPPEMIFAGAKEGHYKRIKMMRGVPGVRAERFQEAMTIRHCALSLVGEPIFYPHINEFVALLHKERISSFLVCNAQHPDQLAALRAVTQLYVSIDASNAESLRKIDRPLHRDYWQRFLACLDILRDKRFRMRTVFRLTLVKGFNIDSEVEGYADLVARGLPCFVEIKGVTYCGTSTSASAGLTMQNVPFYTEVVAFVEALDAALKRRGLYYGIAAEHAHSCCVLIASRRFFVEGKWHTLISYDKFFERLESGEEFSPEDYMGPPTPDWATWGKGGFDPRDTRVDRKGRSIKIGS
ncbi:MAG: hypothetical protein Q9163_002166 [Psora crenata]